jgi:multiple RNA-binding domain-containing protein 1
VLGLLRFVFLLASSEIFAEVCLCFFLFFCLFCFCFGGDVGYKGRSTPRPNKRPRLGPSPTDEPTSLSNPHPPSSASKSKHNAKAKGKNAAQLDEYTKVMQPRTKKGPLWANEALQPQPQPSSSCIGNVHASRLKLVEKVGADVNEKETDEKEDEEKDEGISDLDWMKKRMTQNIEAAEKVFEQSDDEMNHELNEEESPTEVRIPPTTLIYSPIYSFAQYVFIPSSNSQNSRKFQRKKRSSKHPGSSFGTSPSRVRTLN